MILQDMVAVVATANVTVTTTTEEVAVSSGPCKVTRQTARAIIVAWVQVTTGAGTTTVTPRIRRGTTITGDLLGEANAMIIGGAAGSNEQYLMIASEARAGIESAEYSLTVTQAAATGNGTVLQAGILVVTL